MLLGLWPFVKRRVIGLWSETEFSSFGITIVAGRVVGTVSVCTLEGLATYVLFYCAARVGAASGFVGGRPAMLCCGASDTCWPQLSPITWSGRGAGQLLWTGCSVACAAETCWSKQVSGRCKCPCDGRDGCAPPVEPSADPLERICVWSNSVKLSKTLAGNYVQSSDCSSVVLVFHFWVLLFCSCLVCPMEILFRCSPECYSPC